MLHIILYYLKLPLLKMLVILRTLPVASPREAVLLEQTVAEVALHYLVGKVLRTVDVGSGIAGINPGTAFAMLDQWII